MKEPIYFPWQRDLDPPLPPSFLAKYETCAVLPRRLSRASRLHVLAIASDFMMLLLHDNGDFLVTDIIFLLPQIFRPDPKGFRSPFCH